MRIPDGIRRSSVIAGMIRTAARMQSMERWQARWDRSSKGRWTHRLIPNLEAWISRKSYLKRFGHDNTDECSWCGSEIAEDANHIIFECGRFSVNRQGLEDNLRRPITVDNLFRNKLKTSQKWEATYTFAAEVMLELRRVERNRWRAEEV
ncbi:uncharacterized protein [Drosophila virilis]|uniref:uncharacterized protein n=1 Tax=Drosophila virilis TaxID=7244 RepID=UPI0038B34C2D